MIDLVHGLCGIVQKDIIHCSVHQKYTLLESTIPITFVMTDTTNCVSTLDKIVYVCCALCNCCLSVVNFDYITNTLNGQQLTTNINKHTGCQM